MTAAAQGINTLLKRVKQSALGVPGTTGSQYMRRVTATFNKQSDSYTSNEIVSHQQSTGATQGPGRVAGTLNGEVSPGSYALEYAALLRKDFVAAFAAITTVGLTIAGSGPTYTVTRGTGNFLTDGVKKGMVVQLTVGSLNAANISKNLIVTAVTATILTVVPLNGVALVAEGPISGCTVSAPGKVTYAPTTGHTRDYFTWEKWYSDISKSEVFTDVMIASADITLPASGIPTVVFDAPGLGRTPGTSEVLTSPTAASTTNTIVAVQGKIIVDGVVTNITGAQFKIDGTTSTADPEVGSNQLSDLQRGKIMASGTITAKFTNTLMQAIREAQSVVTLVLSAADSALPGADFQTYVFPASKLFGDDADDGDKQVVRTYPFTAQYNGAGGTGTDSFQTICMIQDSQAA